METLKELFLMRHAKAESGTMDTSDYYRPLAPRGVADAQLIAKRNREALAKVKHIWSSPALRARMTAHTVCEAASLDKKSIKWDESIYDASPQAVINLIRNLPNDAHSVMLFGHNPSFTSIANFFLREHLPNIPTSGLVSLTFSATNWAEISRNCLVFSAFDFPKRDG